MASSDNNLRIPDDLLGQARRIAELQGRTADDLAADALQRYLAHQTLEELSRFGQRLATEQGLAGLSEAEREEYVARMIREHRRQPGR